MRGTYLIYQDNEVRRAALGRAKYENMNATAHWLNHFSNSLYLKFMLQKGDTLEKRRAGHELAICERKMTYWQRHPNWRREECAREAEKLKKQWQVPA